MGSDCVSLLMCCLGLARGLAQSGCSINKYLLLERKSSVACCGLRSHFLVPSSVRMGLSPHAPEHAHTSPLHPDSSQRTGLIFLGSSPFPLSPWAVFPFREKGTPGQECVWHSARAPWANCLLAPESRLLQLSLHPQILDILPLPLCRPLLSVWPQTPETPLPWWL